MKGNLWQDDTPAKDNAASEAASAPASKEQGAKAETEDKDDILSRRIPNPAKDAQLRKALDLIKDPAQWQKSLGLAAKKPAPKKAKAE